MPGSPISTNAISNWSFCRISTLATVLCGLNLVTVEFEQGLEHLPAVGVVLDDQDPAEANQCGFAIDEPFGGFGLSTGRQAYDELASGAQSSAIGRHGSAVQFDEFLHQGESDAHAAIRAVASSAGLHKQIKDAVQHVGWNAVAGVADAEHDVLSFGLHRKPDLAAGRRVFHGVVQQVDLDLLESYEISVDKQWSGFHVDQELLIATVDLRSYDFHRRLHGFPQIAEFQTHIDFAEHDPRDVQQVIQQAGHQTRLTLDHLAGLLTGSLGLAVLLQHVGGIEHRTERIAQFVRQDGQKLIPALHGLAALEFRLFTVGDVLGDAGDRNRLVRFVGQK